MSKASWLVSAFGHVALVAGMAHYDLSFEQTPDIITNDSFTSVVAKQDLFQPPQPIAGNNLYLVIEDKTLPLQATYDFCTRRRDLCDFGLHNKTTRTDFNIDELAEMNDLVNNSYSPALDDEIFGRIQPDKTRDVWLVLDEEGEPDTQGRADCEKYALKKRHELIKRGWPAKNLKIAVVKQLYGNKEYHAILIAQMPNTGQLYGLDNMFPNQLLTSAEINDHYDMYKINDNSIARWRNASFKPVPSSRPDQ